jgi:hypothetical protein
MLCHHSLPHHVTLPPPPVPAPLQFPGHMPQHPPGAGPYTTIPYGMQPVNPWGGALPPHHLHHGHHAAPARMPQTHEYQSTDKVRNQANLNKKSLKLVPVEGRPGVYQLQFTFDASAPCRVTTFVLGGEDPRQGCAITTSSSRVRQPVPYQPGVSSRRLAGVRDRGRCVWGGGGREEGSNAGSAPSCLLHTCGACCCLAVECLPVDRIPPPPTHTQTHMACRCFFQTEGMAPVGHQSGARPACWGLYSAGR